MQRKGRPLSPGELERYDRQLRIPTFSHEIQQRLKKSKVAILGLGGTGCPCAIYLSAAGVGEIRIVEHDKVELSNLNRQILYGECVLREYKVEVGTERLRDLNRDISLEAVKEKVTEKNVEELIRACDFVVDGFDKVRDRLIVNQACLIAQIPANHAFVHGFRGEVVTVIPGQGPCLRCFIDDQTALTSLSGVGNVIGVAAGVVGLFQATDVIKHLTSIGEIFPGQRLLVDLLDFTLYHLEQERRRNCPHCNHLQEDFQ